MATIPSPNPGTPGLDKEMDDLKKQNLQAGKDLEGAKAQIKSLTEEITKLNKMYVTAADQVTALMQKNEELQRNQKEVEKTGVLPEIGTKVVFINHSGDHENATVIGHSADRVTLAIQGTHPNDKYTMKDIPEGKPGQINTFIR